MRLFRIRHNGQVFRVQTRFFGFWVSLRRSGSIWDEPQEFSTLWDARECVARNREIDMEEAKLEADTREYKKKHWHTVSPEET